MCSVLMCPLAINQYTHCMSYRYRYTWAFVSIVHSLPLCYSSQTTFLLVLFMLDYFFAVHLYSRKKSDFWLFISFAISLCVGDGKRCFGEDEKTKIRISSKFSMVVKHYVVMAEESVCVCSSPGIHNVYYDELDYRSRTQCEGAISE